MFLQSLVQIIDMGKYLSIELLHQKKIGNLKVKNFTIIHRLPTQ